MLIISYLSLYLYNINRNIPSTCSRQKQRFTWGACSNCEGMKYSFNAMKEDHPESSVEKKHKKSSSSLWHVVFGTFHDNKRHISVLRFEKKVKTQQTGEKFLISLWLYISDFGEPNFCEPSLSVRRWWLEVWWRVRKPWDQKQLIHGCTVEGPDVTGEVVEGFREQRWFDWIVCLGQKEVISLWYIWIWVPMWYIWIWVSDV